MPLVQLLARAFASDHRPPTLGNEDYTPRAPQCPRIGPQRLKRLDRARRHGTRKYRSDPGALGGKASKVGQKTNLLVPAGPRRSTFGPFWEHPRASRG